MLRIRRVILIILFLSLPSCSKYEDFFIETLIIGDSRVFFFPLNTQYVHSIYERDGARGRTLVETLSLVERNYSNLDRIIIMAGINDVLINSSSSYDEFIEIWKMRFEELPKSLTSKIFVISVIPYVQGYSRNFDFNNLNNELERSLSDLNICFVNLREITNQSGFLRPEYSIDGLHLNDRGYSVIFHKILDMDEVCF